MTNDYLLQIALLVGTITVLFLKLLNPYPAKVENMVSS